MTRLPRMGVGAVCAVLLIIATGRGSRAAELNVGASVAPAYVHVGESASYTAFVELPPGALLRPRWVPPDTSEALTWGRLRTSHRPALKGRGDTLFVEATVQAFQLGNIVIPGLAFADGANPGSPPMRLPGVRLSVLPVIPATDSTADLKPVRGPLKAPWWEVVPWVWVILAALGAIGLAWVLTRRRRRALVTLPATVMRDPSEIALARLEQLRARRLPESGEFGVHALELTSILRRFLEATSLRLRPGFTTAELTRRLQDESVPQQEATALQNLLRVWDRVKFGRLPFTLDEARRSEEAVEQFVRQHRRPGSEQAA